MVIPRNRNQERLRVATDARDLPADGGANGPVGSGLVFAEKLFPVFDEADQHNHC